MYKKSKISTIFVALLCLTGCIETIEEQGYATSFAELSQDMDKKITTKQQVKERLGSPSTISTFGDETWFYIRSKTERVAFFEPEELAQDVLSISYDVEGNINGVEFYTLKDGRKIEFAKDVTPTEGNELTFGEQLIGNLGKFNPAQGQ